MNAQEVARSITLHGWYAFGNGAFECPGGVGGKHYAYYMKRNKLPSPCDACFKTLVFWGKSYSLDTVAKFGKLITSLGEELPSGKFNEGVAVFYFREQQEMLGFNQRLQLALQEYAIKGFVGWRRACKEYQDLRPDLWKNAKEMKGGK